MDKHEVAVIVGAGPGLGCSLARRCARAEMHVALVARDAGRLETIAAECSGVGHNGRAYACDATHDEQVDGLFLQIAEDLGTPDLVIYNAGAFVRRSILETTAEEFEQCWRVGCYGGFLVGRAAARAMVARSQRRALQGGDQRPCGTIIFTGATASLRGSAQFHNLAVGKFGLRALAQSMARELQPQGIHVAHVVIDGRIRPHPVVESTGERVGDDMLDADAIAEAYYQLHHQHRSAWSAEIDLRPWLEKF